MSSFPSVKVSCVSDICSKCTSCISAKMHKTPFSTHVSNTEYPFQLVYSDLWGPAPMISVLDHRFYVIFVDDFTRFTWLFLLERKSDVFPVFLHFNSLVETQFSAKIKTLRSDGGGEFINAKFKSFCLEHDILHQFSYPYSPQQNGVAERKHRQIVESALSMLHHSNLSPSYWSYAFSIAVYLINRLPTSVLQFVSPWEKLYCHTPSLHALRTFGCACYPLLRPYASHKFDPKSKQCIFLGYPLQYKGYICLDALTGKIYISCHCVFDESVFPSFPTSSAESPSSFPTSFSSDMWFSFIPLSSLSITQSSPISSAASGLAESTSCSELPSSIPSPNPCPESVLPVSSSVVSLESSIPVSTTAPSLSISIPTFFPVNTNAHPMLIRSKNGISKPKVFAV